MSPLMSSVLISICIMRFISDMPFKLMSLAFHRRSQTAAISVWFSYPAFMINSKNWLTVVLMYWQMNLVPTFMYLYKQRLAVAHLAVERVAQASIVRRHTEDGLNRIPRDLVEGLMQVNCPQRNTVTPTVDTVVPADRACVADLSLLRPVHRVEPVRLPDTQLHEGGLQPAPIHLH